MGLEEIPAGAVRFTGRLTLKPGDSATHGKDGVLHLDGGEWEPIDVDFLREQLANARASNVELQAELDRLHGIRAAVRAAAEDFKARDKSRKDLGYPTLPYFLEIAATLEKML